MAIRIRVINGSTVALCAAKTYAKEDDIYLDDSVHHALSTKYGVDWLEEGFLKVDLADDKIKKLMLDAENESERNQQPSLEEQIS